MAENINENGLPPVGEDISQYQVASPSILDSQPQSELNTMSVLSPAVLDNEYQATMNDIQLNDIGIVSGKYEGKNLVMFL